MNIRDQEVVLLNIQFCSLDFFLPILPRPLVFFIEVESGAMVSLCSFGSRGLTFYIFLYPIPSWFVLAIARVLFSAILGNRQK